MRDAAESTLPSYKMYLKMIKKTTKRGWGNCVDSESIQACEIQLKSTVNYKEAKWCRIETQGGKSTVGVVYSS